MVDNMEKRRKKILIVDDSSSIRSLVERMLKHNSIETEIAVNGREAVKKWHGDEFGVILMDINMPEMDGLSATRTIRRQEMKENREYTPIVAVTGQDMGVVKKQALEAGMDGFIAKPFTTDVLLGAIISLTETSNQSDRQFELYGLGT